jgi:hypothetical protein
MADLRTPALRMVERLGRRILGDKVVEQVTEARKVGTDRFGSRVTDPIVPAEPTPTPAAAPAFTPEMLTETIAAASQLRAQPGESPAEAFTRLARSLELPEEMLLPTLQAITAAVDEAAAARLGVSVDELPPSPAAAAVDAVLSATELKRTADANGDGYASVREIEEVLQEQPELLDQFIAAENERTTPRVSAYRVFLKIEQAAESPRAEVLADLTARV